MTMHATVATRRDRTGHPIRAAIALLAVCVAGLLFPAPARGEGPGKYRASRFDVRATVLTGGSLEIVETIAFDFQSGTFQKLWRDLPESRTDGIEVVEARMDGVVFSRGEGPGEIAVTTGRSTRVEWRFTPTGPSTHTFELRYIARGVAYRVADQDVVRWRLLPSEHRYAIAQSRSTIAAAVPPAQLATVEQRRVDSATATVEGTTIEIAASGIEANGWMVVEARYPAGSIIATAPAWQQRQDHAAALAPRWLMAAGGIFIAGVLLLLTLRSAYPSPGTDVRPAAATTEPPEPLPAALAAALAGKGRASAFHPVATLLDLADRGVLVVRELPRKLGTRRYGLSQVRGKHDLSTHEAEALSIAFADQGEDVTMTKAHSRLARGARRFSAAVYADLDARGLLDHERKAARKQLLFVSTMMLILAGIACIAVAPFIPRFDAWLFLLPTALALAGLTGMIMTASTTPLSDAGLVEMARWRGFKQHLKTIAGSRDDAGRASLRSRWIVYGIALGLAAQWSRYLKKHPGAAPPWFVAGAHGDAEAGFAAFVGSGAASTGSAAGAGGGAAGGGGSGAG